MIVGVVICGFIIGCATAFFQSISLGKLINSGLAGKSTAPWIFLKLGVLAVSLGIGAILGKHALIAMGIGCISGVLGNMIRLSVIRKRDGS